MCLGNKIQLTHFGASSSDYPGFIQESMSKNEGLFKDF